ncbi:putative disease resistance protein RGA4 [Hordeum vulgare]|nr:putative disease resistance protein RGA4 [Hordeum vulgare]
MKPQWWPRRDCSLDLTAKDGQEQKSTTKNVHDVFNKNVNLEEQYPELFEQANLIMKKCRGLPLALVTIGGFLANQPKTASEWRKLNDHISAELETNPELETIKAVIMKSYDGLLYHLKACFLYLAIFPEDQQIARRRLVLRWIAEGYSREMRGKSVEEVLDCYFMEFLSRSMILPSQLPTYSRKGIDSCHVHDLIREIAITKSMEESLVFTLEEGCSLSNQGTVRHLAVSSNWKGDRCEFENIVDLSRVRSLTVLGKWKPFFISDKMRLVRVLDLEGTSGLVDHHLRHIGKLVHLRYLSLKGHGTNISPAKFVGEPERTPDARYFSCLVKALALDDGAQFNRRDVYTAFCCSILPHYAAGRNRGGVEVPRGMWKLKALHALRVVEIAGGCTALEDMKRLTRLRRLGLIGISKRNDQELCSAIARLSSLESLSLCSDSDAGLSGCLDGLSSPPENLQSLKLHGNLVKVPGWIKGLKNLVKMELVGSRISEHDEAIRVLGNLPNLATVRQ